MVLTTKEASSIIVVGIVISVLPISSTMLALVAATIHCVLYEYSTAKMVIVMLSQDDYQGTFCVSTAIDCNMAETSALIHYTLWAASYHPSPIGTPPE
jgi:hypothetical protein